MSKFWKARLLTFLWTFGLSWVFTGQFFHASLMFLMIALGNTFIMWWLIGKDCSCHA